MQAANELGVSIEELFWASVEEKIKRNAQFESAAGRVLEKNADVGGTWLENIYPGCRVDVPNHLYSYSFRQRSDWPQRHSVQSVLLDYFRDAADEYDLRKDIRFDTEVTSMSINCSRLSRFRSEAGAGGSSRRRGHAGAAARKRPKAAMAAWRWRFLTVSPFRANERRLEPRA